MDYITVEGRRLECRWINPEASGPTILFLHHGLGCVSTWRDFPDKLCAAANLPGLVYSRLGYGGSDPLDRPRTPTYLNDEAVADVPKAVAAAGLKRFILVGHSDGGTMSLIQASTQPEGLAAVVVLAAHMFVEQSNLDAIAETRAQFQSTDLRDKLKKHHGSNVDGAFFGWADNWLDPAFTQLDISGYAASIQCPVLAIRGKRDEYGSPSQIERLRASATCPLEILEPDCGHFPHQEDEAAVLAAITRFLGSVLS